LSSSCKAMFFKWALLLVFSMCCLALAQRGILYGLTEHVALVRIDPFTARQQPFGQPLPDELQGQSIASLDEQAGLYYLIGYNDSTQETSLISLNLFDGTMQQEVVLPFEAQLIVGVGEYCNVEPVSGDVFATGPDPAVGGAHHIVRVHTGTKQITSVGSLPSDDLDVLGGASVYDPKNQILFLQFGIKSPPSIKIFGFNVKTGQLVYSLDNPLNMETMNYDEKTGLIYGIGLTVYNSTNFKRTVITLDGSTGKFQEVAVIPGYFFISSSISALDILNRRLFVFLSPIGNDVQFDLVSINVDTYAILFHPRACTDSTACPWSLQYYVQPL